MLDILGVIIYSELLFSKIKVFYFICGKNISFSILYKLQMARLRVKRYGTRAEVMNGTARMTQGRLTKEDFTYNEEGRIVSKKKSKLMKTNANPLRKKGLLQNKKGVFGPRTKKKRRKSKNEERNNFSNAKNKKKQAYYRRKK